MTGIIEHIDNILLVAGIALVIYGAWIVMKDKRKGRKAKKIANAIVDRKMPIPAKYRGPVNNELDFQKLKKYESAYIESAYITEETKEEIREMLIDIMKEEKEEELDEIIKRYLERDSV